MEGDRTTMKGDRTAMKGDRTAMEGTLHHRESPGRIP
jgi:hypothetical protein